MATPPADEPMADLAENDVLEHDSDSDTASVDGDHVSEAKYEHDRHDHDQHISALPLPPKRKGGRKPIYSTVEERKQRNRQAQAAFRERRTEYIKQLEITLKEKDDLLESYQNDQNVTSSQCSSLRYTVSVMERVMLERGIDVEAEMRARGGSRGPTSSGSSSSPHLHARGDSLPSGNGAYHQTQGAPIGSKPKPNLKAKIAQLNGGNGSSPVDGSHMLPSPAMERLSHQAQVQQIPGYEHHQRTPSNTTLPYSSLASPAVSTMGVTHEQSLPQHGLESVSDRRSYGSGGMMPTQMNYMSSEGTHNLGKLPPSVNPYI